ncbi:alpha/beta fold hydrolase [Glaciecola siphonariae]|uniref:Alpha/beta fold hydrolase n=1 Tax=Glaciecola siphonariae TaxID=521012 RepID=A0ABV9LRT7_9ALTE
MTNMHTISVPSDGTSAQGLFYQVHGPTLQSANDTVGSSLPALVLIHGLFGNSDNLSVIRRAFEHERIVISIDLPNHGKSLRTELFSFDDCASHITQLLRELAAPLQIASYVLVGHSLGGKVSMLVAKHAAELISKLVIMDIAPIEYSARHHNVFNGLNNVDLSLISSRSEAKTQLAEYVQDPGTQAFLLKSLFQDANGQWQWRFNLPLIVRDYALLSAWPLTGLCYAGPTLFIKGAESDYILPKHQATIVEQFPNASAKIVQAGHWLHAQKPQVVNALITKFLRGE